MTDNDIKKALEICQGPHDNDTCNNCKYKRNFGCRHALCNDILDYINRLEAENERLKTEKDNLIKTYSECQVANLKEFAERLKNKKARYNADNFYVIDYIPFKEVDNLLKEMVGE